MKSDPREKFVELAEKRVNNTLRGIRLIGNLSNASNYSYTDEDVSKIYRTLRKALEEMKNRFVRRGLSEKESFKL